MAQNRRAGKQKHVPQRTCIACRQVAGKRTLLRVVRTDDGVEIDPSGKKPGRGAYIHPYQVCWRAVLESNRLEKALRTRLSDESRQALLAYMATLPESEIHEPETDKPEADKPETHVAHANDSLVGDRNG